MMTSGVCFAGRDPFAPVIGQIVESDQKPDTDPFKYIKFVGFVEPLTGGGRSIVALSVGGSKTILKSVGESFDIQGEPFLLKAASLSSVNVLHKPSGALRRIDMTHLDIENVSNKSPASKPEQSLSEGADNMTPDGKLNDSKPTVQPTNKAIKKGVDEMLSGIKP
ncbi:MAG: hypothetical protein VKK59_05850 [Vampirovibrionales bacterium]|nr:hypothetical protein [Vampirovibrionales bacterium]